jgi:hypothetical protein
MAKPVNKAEAKWLFWRYESSVFHEYDRNVPWMKKMMRRARRQWVKQTCKKHLNDSGVIDD